jgi:hypothetical protein
VGEGRPLNRRLPTILLENTAPVGYIIFGTVEI